MDNPNVLGEKMDNYFHHTVKDYTKAEETFVVN
jgi:hypothetical protein